jgi:hypothetical protein
MITVDSSEENPEGITYTELSDDDYTALFESGMADVIKRNGIKFHIWWCGTRFYFSKAGRKKEHFSLHS